MEKMKKFTSRGLVGGIVLTMLLFSTAFASTAFAGTENKGVEKEVDGIKVNLIFMNEDVKTGSNDLEIKLYDNNDNPISDVKVKITADMDRTNDDMNMSNSEPLQIDLESSTQAGEYTGAINFTDDGKWMMKVNFNIDGKDSVADFQINVAKSGANWYIIGGFLGFIILVIVFAAIYKKRKSIRK